MNTCMRIDYASKLVLSIYMYGLRYGMNITQCRSIAYYKCCNDCSCTNVNEENKLVWDVIQWNQSVVDSKPLQLSNDHDRWHILGSVLKLIVPISNLYNNWPVTNLYSNISLNGHIKCSRNTIHYPMELLTGWYSYKIKLNCNWLCKHVHNLFIT